MPKRSDSSCKPYYSRVREHKKSGIRGRFCVVNGIKLFSFNDTVSNEFVAVPIKLIDRLREDEWVYDSSDHNSRKEKVK
jgi:hypothetical protein